MNGQPGSPGVLKIQPFRLRWQPYGGQRPVIDGEGQDVGCSDQGPFDQAHSEPSRAEAKHGRHEERISYPVGPVGVVSPNHSMRDRRIEKDCERRCQSREFDDVTHGLRS
jgi:hypothetical protein